MSICSKCGNLVEFRYVNGKCIPMHFDGGCIGSRSKVNDYSGYNSSHESMCFGTTCPECGDDVFFVRHNGGGVWLDPPLGWPWYKHGCFNSADKFSGTYQSALVTNETARELRIHTTSEIWIVKKTYVEPNKNYTDIVLDMGKPETFEIRVKNNAGFLLGKLCVLDRNNKTIWPFYEPKYLFTLYDPEKHKYIIQPSIKKPEKKKHGTSRSDDLVKCSICDCQLLKKNVRRHMKKVHINENNQ